MMSKNAKQITEAMSSRLRRLAIDVDRRRLLITKFDGSKQSQDFTLPANCQGFGRLRHFRRHTPVGWPENPLPNDPACSALGLDKTDVLQVQAFQNAACNWRCWYCFVDFKLLMASRNHSDWKTADELVELYLSEHAPPPVIDLSGGQPDLTPEWVPWMMRALERRGLRDSVYLWSDDNLSNDYFHRYLSDDDRHLIFGWPMYGRVGCFKGIDADSFQFNTSAEPEGFDRQFALFQRMLETGVDLYAYATFPTPNPANLGRRTADFVDRLQSIHPNLPLRTVPLEVSTTLTPTAHRIREDQVYAAKLQYEVISCWLHELENRFSASERETPIHQIDISS